MLHVSQWGRSLRRRCWPGSPIVSERPKQIVQKGARTSDRMMYARALAGRRGAS